MMLLLLSFTRISISYHYYCLGGRIYYVEPQISMEKSFIFLEVWGSDLLFIILDTCKTIWVLSESDFYYRIARQ